MKTYQLVTHEGLIELADRRGWINDSESLVRRVEEISPTAFWSIDRYGVLPPIRLETQNSIRLRIPEAVIHGLNLSLLIEDMAFPGGFAHSFVASPAWRRIDSSHFEYQLRGPVDLPVVAPAMLGLVSHWGHFFVDALDRLLRLEALGALQGPLLVGDTDFFGLQPSVDEYQAVPQVSELVRMLGIRLAPSQMIPLARHTDYRVTDLSYCTLGSRKPAMSSSTFRTVRQRVLGDIVRADDALPEAIFIGRADIKKRYVINQDAIIRRLETDYRTRTVFPEYLTVAQAVTEFSRATRVILPVGSAKFNLAFCRPGTKVICITPQGYACQNAGVVLMTRHICQALDLELAFYDVPIEPAPLLLNSNLIISDPDLGRIADLFDRMG